MEILESAVYIESTIFHNDFTKILFDSKLSSVNIEYKLCNNFSMGA